MLARVRMSPLSTPLREGQLWPEVPQPLIPQLHGGDERPARLSLHLTVLKLS